MTDHVTNIAAGHPCFDQLQRALSALALDSREFKTDAVAVTDQ
jgi:hypothetical protein